MQGKFVPWLYAIGSSIRRVSLRDMAADAALMASAVMDSNKLFDLPVLCVNFDLTLWGEAAGCTTDWEASPPCIAAGGSADPDPDAVRESLRITTLVHAIARVKGALPQHPLVCAIAGPATLAKLLEFEQPVSRMDQFTVGELITEYVNVLCESKIDGVVIVEEPGIDDDALGPWVAGGHYARIAKLTDHYSVDSALLCPQASLSDEQVREFDALTYVVGQPDATIAANFAHAAKGVCVDGFGSGGVKLPAGLDKLETGSYFLTTAWDLGPDGDFASIQQDIAAVSSFLDGGS